MTFNYVLGGENSKYVYCINILNFPALFSTEFPFLTHKRVGIPLFLLYPIFIDT